MLRERYISLRRLTETPQLKAARLRATWSLLRRAARRQDAAEPGASAPMAHMPGPGTSVAFTV